MIDIEKIYSDYLEKQNTENRKKYKKFKGWFSASAAGSCYRKQMYRADGVEEVPIDKRVKRLLRLGTIVHSDVEECILDYINSPGFESEDIEIYTEHRITIPDIKVVGHLDIAARKGDKIHVYDVKTCADYKWKTKFGRNPKYGSSSNYNLQIGTYAMGLGNELEIEDINMSLLWYNKNDSRWREEQISPDWIDKAFEYWAELCEDTEDKKPEELMPGSYGVPMQNWECKYCGYKDIHCPGI